MPVLVTPLEVGFVRFENFLLIKVSFQEDLTATYVRLVVVIYQNFIVGKVLTSEEIYNISIFGETNY